ncbi:hypothetical protein [Paraburkholderia bonniea]|nr:hypothetical protein [Paraburkholderia bonniea]
MALKAMIGPTYNGLPVEYGLSENPSDGLLKDLARVLKQKIAEDPSLTWDLLARYVLKLDPAGLSPIVKRNLDEIIAKIKNEKTADLKQRFEAENNYIDKSVERHVANYKNLIVEQGKSVLAGHCGDGGGGHDAQQAAGDIVAGHNPRGCLPQACDYAVSGCAA